MSVIFQADYYVSFDNEVPQMNLREFFYDKNFMNEKAEN